MDNVDLNEEGYLTDFSQWTIEIVTTGYLSEAEAIDIADMLCYKNAERLFAPREEAYQN